MKKVPNLKTWHQYSTSTCPTIEGVQYAFLTANFYEKEIDGSMWSCGEFYFHDKPILRAWGPKTQKHCSFNSVLTQKGWSDAQAGCPRHEPIEVGGEIAGITLKHQGLSVEYMTTD